MRSLRHQRRGYALLLVLAAAFLIVTLAAILGRLMVQENTQQRAASLEAWTEQVVLSARAWSQLHADTLIDGHLRQLPLESLLPQHISGQIELVAERDAAGEPIVRCTVHLERGRHGLRRVMYWALPLAASGPDGTRR